MIYQRPTMNPEQRAAMIEAAREALLSETGAGEYLDYVAASWSKHDSVEVHGDLDLGLLVEALAEKWEEVRIP